jgi:hypothetical protein
MDAVADDVIEGVLDLVGLTEDVLVLVGLTEGVLDREGVIVCDRDGVEEGVPV